MLELKNITKRYGKTLAVNDLSLTVPKGGIFGFIGPNGAGKTTTIRMAAGVLSPDSGSVSVCGVAMDRHPEAAKKKIGFIPDRPFLYEKLTGMEFLRFIADLFETSEETFEPEAEGLLRMFSLLDDGNELIESYSHGMKQRLIFAAALLHEPQVIIVDEPMVGLDPAGIKLVKNLFKTLGGKGVTVFMSTHTLSLAEDVCERIGIIHRGSLAATGTLEELKDRAMVRQGGLEEIFMRLTMENSG
jgi:ABC-2 type transport system ATP-binding protein